MALISVARGLDYCGNMLGAGKEHIYSPEFLINGADVYFMAYSDVQRNLHLRIWQGTEPKKETPISEGPNFVAALKAIIAGSKGNIGRHVANEAATEILCSLTWAKVSNVPQGNREKYWQAYDLAKRICMWLKEHNYKESEYFKSVEYGSGYECSILLLVEPSLVADLSKDLDLVLSAPVMV